MIDSIGGVQINYDYYQGSYDDIDESIYGELYNIALSSEPADTFLTQTDNKKVLYNFSPIRKNLLEWFDFGSDKTALEIGAGAGAITDILIKRMDRVTCIESSRDLSIINAERHRDCLGLEIFVGELKDIIIDKKYDYVVTVINPDYSKETQNIDFGYDFILRMSRCLKSDGTLILAIDNKYGISKWAINNSYNRTDVSDCNNSISRKELLNSLRSAGLKRVDFYYPIPDHFLPLEIYSSDNLPQKGSIHGNVPIFEKKVVNIFDQAMRFDEIIDDGMFEEYANSFLVFASFEEK